MGIHQAWLEIFYKHFPTCFYRHEELFGERDAAAAPATGDTFERNEKHLLRRAMRMYSKGHMREESVYGTDEAELRAERQRRVRFFPGHFGVVVYDLEIHLWALLTPPKDAPAGQQFTWADVRARVMHLLSPGGTAGLEAGGTRALAVLLDCHAYVPASKSVTQAARVAKRRADPFSAQEIRSGGVQIGGASDAEERLAPVPDVARLMATRALRPVVLQVISDYIRRGVPPDAPAASETPYQFVGGGGGGAARRQLFVYVDGAVQCIDLAHGGAAWREAAAEAPASWSATVPPMMRSDPQRVLEVVHEEHAPPRSRELAPRQVCRGEADQKWVYWACQLSDVYAAGGDWLLLSSNDSDWLVTFLLNMHRLLDDRPADSGGGMARVHVLMDCGRRTAKGRPRYVHLTWLWRELVAWLSFQRPRTCDVVLTICVMLMLTGTDYVTETVPQLGPHTLWRYLFLDSGDANNLCTYSYFMGIGNEVPESPTASPLSAGMGRLRVSAASARPPPPPPGEPLVRLLNTERHMGDMARAPGAPIDHIEFSEHRFVRFLIGCVYRLYAQHRAPVSDGSQALGDYIRCMRSWYDGSLAHAHARQIERLRINTAAAQNDAAQMPLRDRFILPSQTPAAPAADGACDIDVERLFTIAQPAEEQDPERFRTQLIETLVGNGRFQRDEAERRVPTFTRLLCIVRRLEWEIVMRANPLSVGIPFHPLEHIDGVSKWGWAVRHVEGDDGVFTSKVCLADYVKF